jgi:hypothetical protein
MKTFFITLLVGVFIFFSTVTLAKNLQCIGMTPSGLTINVLLDFDTRTLNVNNNVLKIIGETNGKNGLSTESFITGAGNTAYYSITINESSNVAIYEFNSVTQELLNQADVACHENQ